MLKFGYFFGKPSEIQNTTMGKKDEGQGQIGLTIKRGVSCILYKILIISNSQRLVHFPQIWGPFLEWVYWQLLQSW
jgi:hypothetical protein